MRPALTTGDVVTLNGRRGRVLAAVEGRCEVLLSTAEVVECGEHQVRRIGAWWNTPAMRAAFLPGAPRRRRPWRCRRRRRGRAAPSRSAEAR